MLSAGGLLLRKLCGEISCPDYQMCNHHDMQCYPCNSYCDETSHNYDVNICEQQCQDYIHDIMKSYATENNVQDVEKELERVKLLFVVMTVLTVLAIVFTVITICFIWSLMRRIKKIENRVLQRPHLNSMVSDQFPRKNDLVSTVNEKVADKTPSAAALSSSQQLYGESNSVYPTISLPNEDGTLNFLGYDNLAVSWSKY